MLRANTSLLICKFFGWWFAWGLILKAKLTLTQINFWLVKPAICLFVWIGNLWSNSYLFNVQIGNFFGWLTWKNSSFCWWFTAWAVDWISILMQSRIYEALKQTTNLLVNCHASGWIWSYSLKFNQYCGSLSLVLLKIRRRGRAMKESKCYL